MRITDLPTARLRAYLRDTERATGPGNPVVAMLRRELGRRKALRGTAPKPEARP